MHRQVQPRNPYSLSRDYRFRVRSFHSRPGMTARYKKPRGCAAFSFNKLARAPADATAAAVAAGEASGEQRRGDVVGPLCGGVRDDAAVIFVGPDIVDRELALPQQYAQ